MAVLCLLNAATTPLVDNLTGLVVLTVCGWLYTTATFIIWLYQARENLDLRGVTGLTWHKGWTIGSWFIPLANFVIPVLVVGEVHRHSGGRSRGVGGLVGTWWAMLILSIVHFHFTTVEAGRTVVHFVSFWQVVNGLAGAVAAVLAVRLVTRITTVQAGWQPAPVVGVMPTPG